MAVASLGKRWIDSRHLVISLRSFKSEWLRFEVIA